MAVLGARAAADTPRGVIVLDDLHRVVSTQVHALLETLIERLPAQWTLVLASRTLPPLPLARWRAAGELAEFTQEELRFTSAEAAALLAADGAAPERAAELIERTQGWPAGLRLCLAALRARPGGARRSAAVVDRHLFDYLASEVLDDMPAPLHDFLVRCSVLPELTAARAAAVSRDALASAHLDEIERRGLFVTALDAQERTLVLHDLFRGALQERLRQRFAAELPRLLQSAAAGESDPLRRVGYLLRADTWGAAEQALADAAPELFLGGGASEVLRLVEQFPPAWRRQAPRLLRLAGIACCLRWQWADMARWCEAALHAAQPERGAQGGGPDTERQLAMAYLATALYPVNRNEEAEQLIAALRTQALAPQARMVMLLADTSQHFRRGEHEHLCNLYAELLGLLERHSSLFNWWECAPAVNWSTMRGLPPLIERYVAGALARLGGRPLPMRGEVQVQRAFGLLWAARFDEAHEAVRVAEDDMRWLACSGETEIGAQLFRLIESALHGRQADVHARLQALLAREDGSDAERLRLWRHQMAVYGVRMNDVLGGEPEALRQWSTLLFENPLESDEAQNPRAIAVRARYAAAQGRWADAGGHFERLQSKLGAMDVMGHTIQLQLRGAHALLRCGRVAEAAAWLAPALERIEAEGQRGPALLAGPAVLRTLADTAWRGQLAAAQGEALRELAAMAVRLREPPAADMPAAMGTAGDDGLLSAREREVLERIAAGDSNKLIARALDISPHTVKRHVANILDKLGLESRGQASAWLRQQEMG